MQQEDTIVKEEIQQINHQLEQLVRRKTELEEQLRNITDPEDPPFGFRLTDQLIPDGARVAFQGVEGAYSHQAMLRFFGKDTISRNVPTFEGAVKAVVDGEADFVVLPVENTTGGAVGDVLDLQMKYQCCSVAEISIPICHVLLGLPGTDVSQIRTVYSHPQGIAQCQNYLEKHPDWERIPMSNTAASAKMIADGTDRTRAAIASELAGELYGLDVLERNIATNVGNTTRFVIITGQNVYSKKAAKVSICFQCLHQTGNLYRVLSHITYNGLNMTRIESRPVPGHNFEYRFFVEFEGNLSDPVVRRALCGIRGESEVFRVLGCMEESRSADQ